MLRIRTCSAVLSLSLAALFILSSCGSSSTSSSGTTAKHGGTLLITNTYSQFTNFNPYLSSPLDGTIGLAYETLLYINRFDGTVTPWLATKDVFSSDGTTLTFTLRSGVTWSDGQPFTADDVVFTLNMMKQFPALDTNGIWQRMTNVAATDPQTVTITFSGPSLPYLWYIGGQTLIVPKHLWSTYADPTKQVISTPIGTGPFTLESANIQAITLKANPHYWQAGKPYLSTIKVVYTKDNTAADLLLQSSQLDLTNNFTANYKQYLAASPDNHYWWPASGPAMLELNLRKAPFNDLAVRKAISLVMDRNAMVQQGEAGGTAVASPTGLTLPNNKAWLDPQYANLAFGAPDIAQAQSILAAAGYQKGGDGFYVNKDGSPITINLIQAQPFSDFVTNTQIAANNLKQLGFNTNVNLLPIGGFFGQLLGGQYDAAIWFWPLSSPSPYYNLKGGLISTNIGKAVLGNNEGWSDPATDQLLTQYANATDQATQKTAIQGLEKIMVEQLPAIPLFYETLFVNYTSSRLTGWPDADHPFVIPNMNAFPDNEVAILSLSQK